MSYEFKTNQYGCPISCRYCVITKVETRRRLWNQKTLIGLNRAVTIFNPPPDKNDLRALKDFYEFPIELFRGDIVGFNAISDPFWPKYEQELNYFLDKVAPIARLAVGVTKFSLSDKTLRKLAGIPNFRLNVSITGLDKIEKTQTSDRLELLRKAKEFNIKAFPIIHPYIAGMTDLSFLSELKKMGYEEIDIKGLRYCHRTMSEWMPKESQIHYIGTDEQEILPDDGWDEKIRQAGMRLRSLKDWYQSDLANSNITRDQAIQYVEKLLPYANITSSASDQEVISAAVERRL